MGFVDEWNGKFLQTIAEGKPPFDDAGEKYGVRVETVADPAMPYWRVIGVHHLTGAENVGRHHVFVDVLDEAGQRINGSQLLGTKGNLPPFLVRIDKPANEPGTNFPMFKNDVATVAVHWPAEAPLPSDKVVNLHTGHPDEEPGTTLFHHSFYMVFQKATAPPIVRSLEEVLWEEGEQLVMPLDPEAELFKFARQQGLGERLTREYVIEHEGKSYVAQIYQGGLVYVPTDHSEEIKVLEEPPA